MKDKEKKLKKSTLRQQIEGQGVQGPIKGDPKRSVGAARKEKKLIATKIGHKPTRILKRKQLVM